MERAVSPLCSMVFICAVLPAPAAAQPAMAAAPAAFDLRAVSGAKLPGGARPALRSQAFDDEGEPTKPEKTKLRLTYQPEEEGPRFEIGTYGSRKGAMKSRLLHVAMDWNF